MCGRIRWPVGSPPEDDAGNSVGEVEDVIETP